MTLTYNLKVKEKNIFFQQVEPAEPGSQLENAMKTERKKSWTTFLEAGCAYFQSGTASLWYVIIQIHILES